MGGWGGETPDCPDNAALCVSHSQHYDFGMEATTAADPLARMLAVVVMVLQVRCHADGVAAAAAATCPRPTGTACEQHTGIYLSAASLQRVSCVKPAVARQQHTVVPPRPSVFPPRPPALSHTACSGAQCTTRIGRGRALLAAAYTAPAGRPAGTATAAHPCCLAAAPTTPCCCLLLPQPPGR